MNYEMLAPLANIGETETQFPIEDVLMMEVEPEFSKIGLDYYGGVPVFGCRDEVYTFDEEMNVGKIHKMSNGEYGIEEVEMPALVELWLSDKRRVIERCVNEDDVVYFDKGVRYDGDIYYRSKQNTDFWFEIEDVVNGFKVEESGGVDPFELVEESDVGSYALVDKIGLMVEGTEGGERIGEINCNKENPDATYNLNFDDDKIRATAQEVEDFINLVVIKIDKVVDYANESLAIGGEMA